MIFVTCQVGLRLVVLYTCYDVEFFFLSFFDSNMRNTIYFNTVGTDWVSIRDFQVRNSSSVGKVIQLNMISQCIPWLQSLFGFLFSLACWFVTVVKQRENSFCRCRRYTKKWKINFTCINTELVSWITKKRKQQKNTNGDSCNPFVAYKSKERKRKLDYKPKTRNQIL